MAEDDENDRFLFGRTFSRMGFESHFACDGVALIEYITGAGSFADRIRNPLPDALFLDLKMPRMNGFEVLEWFCAHKQLAIVPTIVFSASSLTEDIQRAYELGATTYFVKPTNFEALVGLFKKIVDYWCAAERLRLCRPAPG